MTFEELKNIIEKSGRNYDLAMIEKAYLFAAQRHEGQLRRSGEPYIIHPIAVASYLVDLGLDSACICAALLHDVVEDTDTSLAEIKAEFGEEVEELVNGVTKLGKISFSSVEEEQAENLRKMLLAMSKDIRVMIIKLNDRLHNMRTMDYMAEQKRRDKSRETMEVYAPIAHRLGMEGLKDELQDLSLKYLDPKAFDEITEILDDLQEKNGQFIEKLTQEVHERLKENGLEHVEIQARVKSVYGIYRKLFIQNRSLEEIYDIYAIRILVDTVPECYTALGVVHDMYTPIPKRFKDYISTPKSNMYQSLHTTVIAENETPFEIQIRTYEMHREAEYGVAAHWKYKEGVNESSESFDEKLEWVRQLLESQKESQDATDLLRSIKSDLLPEEVFVLTPKGDVIDLPAGATVIDFAYAIHTAVGNRMIGAKVNGRIVPINYQVNSSEVVEVILGPKDKGPSRDWLNIVQT
ncbi:MAG: bifunctional (p)ppGpp synthetase/guanosine-3',5'-bis(diphosphate) 3'-pyrophosphohydrolase, partial [Oscillospiraceae bacterium]|nr:bifunctional (p)ppGpp synthetase/guanosine-3',5'-bis(diphosphate) 3'-pyrophosphohydrolase [Oscillospiraceae bacterium]